MQHYVYNFGMRYIVFQKSTLPSVAGIPLGESDSPKYFILETHFDNPQVRGGKSHSCNLFKSIQQYSELFEKSSFTE